MPKPQIITCETHYGAAYGWKIEAAGLLIIADTAAECLEQFKTAHVEEYGRAYGSRKL